MKLTPISAIWIFFVAEPGRGACPRARLQGDASGRGVSGDCEYASGDARRHPYNSPTHHSPLPNSPALEQRRAAQLAADDGPLARVHDPVRAVPSRTASATVGRASSAPVGLSRSASLSVASDFKRCGPLLFEDLEQFFFLQELRAASSLDAVSLVYFSAKPAGSGGIEPASAMLPI